MNEKAVSIIIPTYNEGDLISDLLKHLRSLFPQTEIIVSDGGSTDRTVVLASAMVIVVKALRGRPAQMNAGARASSGDILWFLHADCRPSAESVDLIRATLRDPEVIGGGFRWGLKGSKWYYDTFTAIAHIKNKWRGNLYGDMGIFVRRDAFERLGGFAPIPICEDMEFTRRLKRLGKIVLLDEVLISSDRKLLREGPIKVFIKNHMIKTAFRLGVSPFRLREYY